MRTVTENYTWRQYGRQVAAYLKEAVEREEDKHIALLALYRLAGRTLFRGEFGGP